MFSFDIKNELSKFDSNDKKQSFLKAFLYDESATLINETKNARTVLFPNHRGTNKDSWKDTKQMAFDLNKKNRSVAFLDEHFLCTPDGYGKKCGWEKATQKHRLVPMQKY